MRKLPPQGAKLIKSFEQCRLTRYLDQAGKWTIGWGHLIKPGEDHLNKGPITQQLADNLFDQDMQQAQRTVEASLFHAQDMTDNQYSALVSFQYNTGAIPGSTLQRMWNAGDVQAAADQMLRWNKIKAPPGMVDKDGDPVTHVESAGLTRRREAERTLFLTEG